MVRVCGSYLWFVFVVHICGSCLWFIFVVRVCGSCLVEKFYLEKVVKFPVARKRV